MSKSTHLDEDILDDDVNEDEVTGIVEDDVALPSEPLKLISSRRRLEDILEQKRLERELLDFDYREERRLSKRRLENEEE